MQCNLAAMVGSITMSTPAFSGANFDSSGSCLYHPEVKLTQKTAVDGGKVVYKELRRRCPKCTSSSSHKGKSTSSSPDIIKRHDSHGGSKKNSSGHPSSPNPSLGRSSSRSRSRARSKSPPESNRSRGGGSGGGGGGARSKSPARMRSHQSSSSSSRPPKKKYGTPFDSKGRCHYHPNTQLAKKKLTGGWKLLLTTCPTCIQEEYANDNSDNRSVSSRRSTKSSRSVRSSGGGVNGRKKGPPRNKHNSPRYECPFDNQGYCHHHSHVRLAKKKLTGGWKILQEVCIECIEEEEQHDDNRSVCSRSSRLSRKSTSSRRSVSSRKSMGSRSRHEYADSDSEHSTSQSEQNQQKIVKKMNFTDDNGDEGLYTGHVNSQYKPQGSGKMVYNNGKRFSGEWCEGSKVHGKTTHEKPKRKDRKDKRDKTKESPKVSSKNGSSRSGAAARSTNNVDKERDLNVKQKEEQKQAALREYKELYNTAAQVVKNMMFVDFYGDRGRYTGEVNAQKMPDGMGEIRYDHGLVQEGKWTNGVLDEDGSIISGPKNPRTKGTAGEAKSVSSSRRRARSKDP